MRAILPCADLGTRLGPLTADLTKSMLSLGRSTVIESILHHLAHEDFSDPSTNLHARDEQLSRHVGDGELSASVSDAPRRPW